MATKRNSVYSSKNVAAKALRSKYKKRLALIILNKRQKQNKCFPNSLPSKSSSDSLLNFNFAQFPSVSSSSSFNVCKPSSSSEFLSQEELTEVRRLSKALPLRLQHQVGLKPRKHHFTTETSSNLNSMLPEISSQSDALQIIMCASKYISQLSATVIARVQNGSLPKEVLQHISPHFLSSSYGSKM